MFEPEKVRAKCVECLRAIMVDSKWAHRSNVCQECVDRYVKRFGVRKPVKKKPKRGNA